MERTEEIIEAINQYAKAYNHLEKIQRAEAEGKKPLIPIQDQKTGAIGEFWSMMYLQQEHPRADVTLMGHNDSYDIEIKKPRKKAIKVQVKTIAI